MHMTPTVSSLPPSSRHIYEEPPDTPWSVKLYEGKRTYYFKVDTSFIKSYTITIKVPLEYTLKRKRAGVPGKSGGPSPIRPLQSSFLLPMDSIYVISFPVSIRAASSSETVSSNMVKSFTSMSWTTLPAFEMT